MPALQPGDYVRVKLPGHHAKGDLRYSKPRKILDHRGQNAFLLDDFKVWNASKLSKVPREVLPQITSEEENSLSPATSWFQADNTLQPDNFSLAREQLMSNAPDVDQQGPQTQQTQPLRRSCRERRPPERFGHTVP